MAIAVHPAYVAEQVNAVAITGGSTFTVASQVGYESVVEPMDPTASAEVLRFLREPGSQRAISLTVSARSSFNDGRLLWSDAQLDVLAGLLYTVHDHFGMLSRERTGVEDARFDVEIERTANGAIHIKQVRRYLGP
jgi:hypothetical protein